MTVLTMLLTLNLVASLTSAIWAVLALREPSFLSGSTAPSQGELFYSRMYAARAVPLEIMAGLLPIWPGGSIATYLVFAAAIIQLLDVGISAARHDVRMAIGASLGFVVHLISGLALILY